MVANNAEVEASRIRGDKIASEYGIDSDRTRGSGQLGSKARGESIAAGRNDWSWRDFINSYGQANIGGILNRLIQNTKQQIKESEERTADLKQQLAGLQQISSEFFQDDSE
ncbi:hypothetical protein [Calothrix sp. CCY 0018]|uniref:hypothetical protein n=1 Tax=Calothrix sp. CCY 0018 TaxID=3103864 RepID=UPI0039C6D737